MAEDADQQHHAPRSVARLGRVYAALDGVCSRHSLTGVAVAVDDPELGRQLFAAGPDGGAALAACASDGDAAWATVPAADAMPAELETVQDFAATALRLAVVDPGDDETAMEVLARRLPTVRGVERRGRVVLVHAHAGEHDELLARLTEQTTGAPIVVVSPTPEAGGAMAAPVHDRVALVAVLSRPEIGELEVHLAHGNGRTVGRGPLARTAAGAADATLNALRELGLVPDGRVSWARTFDTTPERLFLVGVAVTREGGPTLYGFAPGASPIESAARATLDAVNRAVNERRD